MFKKNQLVGGGSSGGTGTEQGDERANAPADGGDTTPRTDGYTEGIPGPVTRLFVLANRGLSNLIQDLILVSILIDIFVPIQTKLIFWKLLFYKFTNILISFFTESSPNK